MSDTYNPDEAVMLADVIDHLSSQAYHGSRKQVGFAEYRHCRMLLEMIDELENQLEAIRTSG